MYLLNTYATLGMWFGFFFHFFDLFSFDLLVLLVVLVCCISVCVLIFFCGAYG